MGILVTSMGSAPATFSQVKIGSSHQEAQPILSPCRGCPGNDARQDGQPQTIGRTETVPAHRVHGPSLNGHQEPRVQEGKAWPGVRLWWPHQDLPGCPKPSSVTRGQSRPCPALTATSVVQAGHRAEVQGRESPAVGPEPVPVWPQFCLPGLHARFGASPISRDTSPVEPHDGDRRPKGGL